MRLLPLLAVLRRWLLLLLLLQVLLLAVPRRPLLRVLVAPWRQLLTAL